MRCESSWLGTLFIVLAACGGTKPADWQQPVAGAESSRRPPELREPEKRYNASQRLEVPSNALSTQILAVVADASRGLGQSPPLPDSRLYHALDDLAALAPPDSRISYSTIEFVLQRHGIIEPSPNLIVIEGDIDEPAEIASQLPNRLSEILASGKFVRVGIGFSRRRDASDLILLALQESFLSMRPIPRELPLGGEVIVEGELDPSFSEPRIFHTEDSGQVRLLSVVQEGSAGFRSHFRCARRRGPQQLEIIASDSSGATVLANFPIYCGQKAPASIQVEDTRAQPQHQYRETAEQSMLALVNEDRARHGLNPLRSDPRLVAIGRGHSDEMLATGKVRHVSPTTGSAADRIKANNVQTTIVLENVARAYSVREAQLGLMNSPGHRANLLSREVSHIGIGISLGAEMSGDREVIVTQIFISVPEAIDVTSAYREIRSKIRAITAIQKNQALQKVAGALANSIARGVDANTAMESVTARLGASGRQFSKISTVVSPVSRIDGFDPASVLAGKGMNVYGLGIAQSSLEQLGNATIYVVLLLGHRYE